MALLSPAFTSLWSLGQPRALKDSPTLSSQRPRRLGPKRSIPNAHVSSFPARTPSGDPGGGPRSSPCLDPSQRAGRPVGCPCPQRTDWAACPCPRGPSPVTGPSQYTWTYSSTLCPEQRKVTEAASAGFRKADVRGPAAGECRHQSWPACAASRTTHPHPAVAPAGLVGAARLHRPVPWGHQEAGRPEVRQQLDRRVSRPLTPVWTRLPSHLLHTPCPREGVVERERGGETQMERQEQRGERLGRTKKQQQRGVRGASGGHAEQR